MSSMIDNVWAKTCFHHPDDSFVSHHLFALRECGHLNRAVEEENDSQQTDRPESGRGFDVCGPMAQRNVHQTNHLPDMAGEFVNQRIRSAVGEVPPSLAPSILKV
jgi:hypothetical protein